ncbi:MAG: Maf-like protein [Planctomycetes bacterium]|nr:Maf-like protein [Planctomycetota bacterium]
MAPNVDLWLASTSPRRRELLAAAGVAFQLCEPGPEYVPGGGDEHSSERGEPGRLALDRAVRKALGAKVPATPVPVLGVDTVVDLDGLELGKPADRAAAERMLRALVGRRHLVHTAHCLCVPHLGRSWCELATAEVECGPPPEAELQRYLDSGQWRGKAGSYGVQDDAQSFFRVVRGAFDTVVGLHLPAVRALLARARAEA